MGAIAAKRGPSARAVEFGLEAGSNVGSRTTTMTAWRAPRERALALLLVLLAGCVQRPVVRDHPELAARVTRMEAAPPAIVRDAEKEGRSDPSVKPAAARGPRQADETTSVLLPSEALTLEE